MIGNRISAIALAVASANFFSTSVSNCLAVRRKLERGGQTTQGHCASIEFGLAINRGRLYSASGYYVFGYPAQLGGRVSRSGDVRASGVAGPRTALVTGRFRRFQAAGLGPVAGRLVSVQASGLPLL